MEPRPGRRMYGLLEKTTSTRKDIWMETDGTDGDAPSVHPCHRQERLGAEVPSRKWTRLLHG